MAVIVKGEFSSSVYQLLIGKYGGLKVQFVFMDWTRLSDGLAESLADRTVRQTLQRLRFLDSHGALESSDAFRAFYIAQKRLGLSQASLNKYVQSATHYCRYSGFDWKLPKHLKEYAKARKCFSDDEINQMIDLGYLKHEDTTTPLLITLLCFSGARPSEICKLTQAQVDYQNNGLWLAGTKVGADRFIPIPEKYIQQLKDLPNQLFTQTDVTARDALKRRCEILNIPYRSTYSLRHSRLNAWSNTIDLPSVSNMAGTSINVIMDHYWHASVTHLQAMIKRDTLRRSLMTPDEKVREIAKLLEEMKNSFKLDEDQDLDTRLDQQNAQISFTVKVKKLNTSSAKENKKSK